MSTPQLVELPQRTTVVRREKVPAQQIGAKMGEFLPAVFAYMGQHGLAPAGPPIARWHGMDDPMDMEAGIPVAGPTADVDAPFSVSSLPGGRCAVLMHVGPYDRMPASWKRMFAWLEEQGLSPEASWEEYLTDPGSEPDSSKWQTKICVKVAD